MWPPFASGFTDSTAKQRSWRDMTKCWITARTGSSEGGAYSYWCTPVAYHCIHWKQKKESESPVLPNNWQIFHHCTGNNFYVARAGFFNHNMEETKIKTTDCLMGKKLAEGRQGIISNTMLLTSLCVLTCTVTLFGLSQPTSGQEGSEVCIGAPFFWKGRPAFRPVFNHFLLTNGENNLSNLRTQMSIFGGDV